MRAHRWSRNIDSYSTSKAHIVNKIHNTILFGLRKLMHTKHFSYVNVLCTIYLITMNVLYMLRN